MRKFTNLNNGKIATFIREENEMIYFRISGITTCLTKVSFLENYAEVPHIPKLENCERICDQDDME